MNPDNITNIEHAGEPRLGMIWCVECDADGSIQIGDDLPKTCPTCNGTGEIVDPQILEHIRAELTTAHEMQVELAEQLANMESIRDKCFSEHKLAVAAVKSLKDEIDEPRQRAKDLALVYVRAKRDAKLLPAAFKTRKKVVVNYDPAEVIAWAISTGNTRFLTLNTKAVEEMAKAGALNDAPITVTEETEVTVSTDLTKLA